MTASLPDRLRKVADELDSLRLAEDAALMREAAEALSDTDPQGTIMQRHYESRLLSADGPANYSDGRVVYEARP